MSSFAYDAAFSRNLGLVSETEQARLRQARVAIAGLGGVGGAHAQTLARLGIGSFHLADPDAFDIVNINRQLGATTATFGQNKAEVCARMIAGIDPQCETRTFTDGVTEANVGVFLEGVNVLIDGIEFFRIDVRRMLYRECRARGIPVVNAGPIGYGAALLVFMPRGMSFAEYFRIDESMTRAEQLLAFALGLAPGLASDVDPRRVDVASESGPALASACMACAGAAATETLKLLCGRGEPATAPRGIYYDLYHGTVRKLRPRPSLTRSLRGKLLRRLCFARYPDFKTMHERELAERIGPRASVVEG
jgi:molybdopterin/thiamine biosynthesis adenylyltransferase